MRKLTCHTSLSIAAAIVLSAAASVTNAADFTMKISSPVPPTQKDIIYAWMTSFEKGVEAASNGRIDVQLFPANQLGQIPATVEGVAMGTIEMTLPAIGFFGTLDERFGVLDAAGLFDSEAHAMKALQDPDVKAMLATFGERANVEPLVTLVSGQTLVVSPKKVEKVSDLQGLKMRTGGATPLLNEPLEKLGVSPVTLPLGEVLPALQTKVIDASANNAAVMNAFQFQDVANQATYLPGSFMFIGGIVSKDFLAMIGPDLEKIVRDEAQNSLAVYDNYLVNGAKGLENLWTSHGGEIRYFDAEQRQRYLSTVTPVVEKVVSNDDQMKKDYETLLSAAQRSR